MSKPIYQICVSGAARGDSVDISAKLAVQTAAAIAKRGHILLTGATTGLPHLAAKAALHAGGISVGFSPAANRRDHIKSYRLPVDGFSTLLYTGFEYTGRNLLMVRSCDGMIMIGGRIGTLNELTIGIEERKPIGVLLGSGGMTDEVKHVLKVAKRTRTNVIFDEDPQKLVDQVISAISHKYRKLA
jgi:uncharacterized protein (TIGR00725 family)